jgi:uncharacterized protein (DUF486 family)
MSSIKFISRTTAALVLLLAMGAFALSYTALQALAAANGLADWQSYVWPLMLDAALVVCSMAVLRANLQGEKSLYPWFLVILFSVGTLVFNVLHAPGNTLGQVVAAVAPLALFLSFELFVGMLRSELRLHNALQVLADIKREVSKLDDEQDLLQGAIITLEAKRSELQEEIKALRKEKQGLSFEITQETLDRAKAILAERSEITGSELGRVLGKSDRLGRQLKHILQPNGNGVVK